MTRRSSYCGLSLVGSCEDIDSDLHLRDGKLFTGGIATVLELLPYGYRGSLFKSEKAS